MYLRNTYTEARFDEHSGALVHLSRPGGPDLLRASGCRCVEGKTVVSELTEPTENRPFRSLRVTAADGAVTSILASDAVEVTRRFTLGPDDPLLTVTHEVRGTGPCVEILHPGFPRMVFSDDFVDAFEDEEDLYFDGAELGDGRELPCWRVFFRGGHEDGLLLVTRSKHEMSHLQISSRGFDLKPHVMTAYDSDYVLAHSPMQVAKGQEYTVRFEIGPWQANRHEALRRQARLDEPRAAAAPKRCPPPSVVHRIPSTPGADVYQAVADVPPSPSGRWRDKTCGDAPGNDKGSRLFDALDIVDDSIASAEFEPGKWLIADMPWCRGGRALFANAGIPVPPIRFNPALQGLYRVCVGIGNGDGVVLRFSDTEVPVIRIPTEPAVSRTPFGLRLQGHHEAREIRVGVHRMDGCSIQLERFPNSSACTVLDYVRFEALAPAEMAAWEAQEGQEPCIELSGLNDVPDIAQFTEAREPDLGAYRANLWEHANCKVRKVFWRIDGQCADYPSAVNTMRYISARVHGVFTPQAKAYGRALQRTDMLRLAVEAAREYGLSLYGWMRFNSYVGNVQSDFYKKHPELREEGEAGRPAAKLCLAHAKVRQHKIAILVEAARYGLDGLCLGFLRHPPILAYAPVLVRSYTETYGCPPPRDAHNPDERYIKGLPPTDEESMRWFRHRATFMTLFMRELHAALAAVGLARLKIAIWVRPTHCLFDGIDLDTWLDEGLCDEVVAHAYGSHATLLQPLEVSPDWKQKVQSRAKLSYGVYAWQPDMPERFARAIAEGYDGICSYESDYTVLQNEFIDLYRSLRRDAVR